MNKNKVNLPYGRQSLDKEDIQAVVQVLESAFLTTGPAVASFEAELCRITGASHAVACSSGTAALHLACMAVGLSSGDTGVTSPNSFVASANCMEFCGARADFVDIDLSSLCLCVKELEEYCRKKGPPRVVIPVDFAGVPADLPEIKKLAREYGFWVIEDAAHALGSFYGAKGQRFACGSCAHSDLAVFSFHPVKNITTGEGGAVMTNDPTLAERLRLLRNHGIEKSESLSDRHGAWYYEMKQMGFNYRLTDIQCALGLSQLKKLAVFRRRRQKIVSRYNRAFKGKKNLILPPEVLEADACPHLYSVQLKAGSLARKKVYEQLRRDHIYCQIHYIPIYLQPYYADRYGYERGRCHNAEEYYSRCISLPLFPEMTDRDLDRVVDRFLCALDAAGA